MNAPDSLEDDLRALLEPVRPELKARIADELKGQQKGPQKLVVNTRSASLLAAGVMLLLAAGLFAMVRQPRQQMVVETPVDEKIVHRIPSADGGTEVGPPKPDAPPKAGDATESEESKLDRRRREAEAAAEKARAHMRELFNKRVAKLLEMAGDLCKREDFDAAEKLAVQILKIDPNNEAAAKLKEQAHAGARNKDEATKLKGVILKQEQALIIERENAERARLEKAKLEEELKAAKEQSPSKNKGEEREGAEAKNADESNRWYAKAFGQPELYSKLRQELNKPLTSPAIDDDGKSELQKKLKEKVSFNFVDRSLTSVIGDLRELTKLTLIVDPKVAGNGGDKISITLKVQDMELEAALRWILKLADLDYVVKDNAVFVTNKANLPEPIELRIYDIADLTGTGNDEKGPEIQLQATGGESDDKAANAIVEKIKQSVRPDQWDPNSGVSMEVMAGRLVVMQHPAVLGSIDQFLDGLRTKKKNKLAKTVAYHVKNLKDPDPDIRQESCAMLEALGSADAVPGLIEVLDPERKEKDPVRVAAHKALRKISGKEFELADYKGWNDWWNSTKPKANSDK